MRPDHWWGALLAALAGIPVRIGYETPETAPFLTEALPYLPDRHAAREALTLVQAAARYAGASIAAEPEHEPTLPSSATATDAQAVEDLLRTAGVQHVPLLVLHPGAGSPLKSWPLERFVALGAELAAKMHARIAVTGTAGERLLCAQLCACLPGDTLNLAGRLSWGELEALLRRAALVVGVDSGPLHLAVAAGTPSVALFGPADPAQFAPWGPPARHRIVAADLPCQPCRRLDSCHVEPGGTGPPPCMRAIEIAPVLAAAQAALLEGKHAPITTH